MRRPRVISRERDKQTTRGVYVAPYLGPDGEIVLLAITSSRKLATSGPVIVPHGADRVAAAEALWDLLDRVDPPAVTVLRAL